MRDSQNLTFSFKGSPELYAQVLAVAQEREWTVQHVLRKLIPLGLEVYLSRTSMPHPLELSGLEVQE